MSSRSASALLDAALAVPFDPEEEDRRQLALAQGAQWDAGPVPEQNLDVAPENVMVPQLAPDPLVAQADAALSMEPGAGGMEQGLEPPLPMEDGGSGGPALPGVDEDLPPVSQPGAGGMEQGVTRQGGGRRSASALLAEVLPLEQGAGSREQGATAGGGDAAATEGRPRRPSASALLADIPEDSGALRRAGDVPIFLMQGTTTGLKAIADVFGADSPASQDFAERQAFWQSQLSPEARRSQERVAQIQAEAADQGVMTQLGAAGRAFAESPTAFVAQGLGTMAPTVATGGAARLVGAGAAGVQAAQIATGAAMGGGIVKGEIYQAVEQAMLQAGRSPEEAAEAASTAQAYGGENLDQILAGYGLGALASAIGAERLAGRAIAGAAGPTGGVLRVAGRTALQEGLPESAQGSQEQLARNLAQQREDFNVPAMRGVVGAGALEGLAGLAIGGPAGVAAGVGARMAPQRAGSREQGAGAPAAATPEAPKRVVVEQDDVFGEATTAAVDEPGSREQGVVGDERFAPPVNEQRPAEPAGPTGEDLFGEVEQRGETIVTPPPAEAAVVSDLGANLPTVELPVNELQLSRDVPNFKEGADEATGVVEGERLEGTYQRLGTAPIIVWERTDGRREIISGRHRWDLAKRTGEKTIPSQVVREADGFTQENALMLDAELNIRDGQGSIKDYANYFRNAEIDRETATQGGLLSRAKGRAGFEIGRSAGNDLYSAFANGAVSADKAAAIAGAAPGNDAVQRAALARAGNMTAEQLPGFVRVVAGMTTGPAETQTDLFGADDTALVQAERLSKAANAKARELQQQITAVRGAARRPEAAAKMGVNVRDPEGVRRRISQLEGEVERYRNFHQYPEVMAELQTLRVEEGPEDLTLAGPDAQAYFDFADVPKSKQQAGQTAVDAAAEASSVPYAPAPVSARPGVDRSGELRSARERQGIAYRALLAGDAATVAAAIRDGVPLSRLMRGYIGREPASFNIRGAIIKSPQDLALYNLAHRTPFFESLKIAVLDDRRQVIASQVVSTGTLNESLAHPRDILAVIEAARAANPNAKIGGFMIMHNHPSGDPTPSEADRQVTRRMQLAGETIGVPLLDHVITNGERYVSFQESGMLIDPRAGNFARANAKPKLSVLPPAEGAFREGARATWEAAPASTGGTFRISNPSKLTTVRTLLQTADPGMVHILNLDTRYGILSVDRYPLGTKAEDMIKGSLAQGTYAVAISLPMMPPEQGRTLVRALRTGFNDVFSIYVNDAMGMDNLSFREQGLLEEPEAPYGRGAGALAPEQLRQIVTAVHAEAAAQRDGFLRDVRDAARTAGGRAVERIFPKALKKLSGALAKTERSPKVPTDLLRTTIEAPAGGAAAARRVAAKFIEAMRARGYEIYAPDGRPDITDRHDSQDAYKDIALKFVKDGAGVDPVVKEVLVIQPAMLSVKSQLHDYYDRWREALRRGITETANDRVLMLRKAARKAEAQAAKLGQEAYARDSRTPRYQALSAVQSSEDMSSTSLGMSGISGNPASATARAISFVGVSSIREENTAGPGELQAGFRVAEEPARTKPRQLEEKAMRNEALAAETRARLGSEYLPISLNAQAEAAKEWINTNGLDAAKLRIAQLSGEDSVPTPLDFAIGIEAAGRLSAAGDHQGAADIVSTMSHRATGMGQTISTLAMMARLSPEGIVFYGENIIKRYINALPPEAQDRIRALQAEVERLKAELAKAKFDQGSELIRSGKLGDEKIQDRIKRRQRAKVEADLGPGASGPEVTAETKARTQRMNRAVRDVLLGDATKAEATKAIEAILLEQGNLSASEAAAVAKSIADAFFKLMRETRTRLTNEAKGRGGRAGGFDRLLAALREGKDISDADFLGELSRLLGLPGMTPAMARELRAIGQRYERATDPDVRLVLAAQMYEKAHELVPADFWVKVRGFAYLSMLFAPKTWIRNVVGNQIQWIANVGRDAFVTGILDPAISMFTGQRTSAGLKLGARLKGLLAPISDVRRGYLWSKQENPSFNHFKNFMAGVNHLRLLSKLTTQNKYEISDVRSVNGRIFSSGFMRAWEGALSIALGAGDRAFWMSQFRASLAQMQAAAEKNGEWSGQPTPEMIEAAMAEAAYAIYQNPNLLSQGGAKVRAVLNRLTTAGRTDQFGLGTALMAFTQVPGSIAMRGILDWSPLGFIRAMYQGMRGVLYASSDGRRGAKFDQAEFNKTFTQALLGTGGMYAAGFWLYSLGIITASREDDEDLEAMRRASGLGAYRINLTALRRALLSMNWFTPQPPQDGDMIVTYDWAQPVAITVAAGAEYAAMLERAQRSAMKKGLAERASMPVMSLVAGAKSLEELPLLSGLISFMQTAGQRAPAGESSLANALIKTVTGLPSMFVPQLVRQATQLSDNMVRTTRAGVAAEREFDRVLASLPGWSTKYPVRFDVTGQAIERYQYGGNTVWNVLTNPALTTRYKADPVLQEVGRLLNATGDTGVVPREVLRKAKINGKDVELTNNQIAAYQYYVGNFTMSHFRWRMAAPVYARLPDELKAKMLTDDLADIHAAVKSAVLGADPRRLTRRQMFLRQALVNSPLGQSVPPR